MSVCVEGVGPHGRATDHVAWAGRAAPAATRAADRHGPGRLVARRRARRPASGWRSTTAHELDWSGAGPTPDPVPVGDGWSTAPARDGGELTVRRGPVGVRSRSFPGATTCSTYPWWPTGCLRCSACRRARLCGPSSASGRSTAWAGACGSCTGCPSPGPPSSCRRGWRPPERIPRLAAAASAGSGEVAGLRAVAARPRARRGVVGVPVRPEAVGSRRAGG